MRLGAAGFRGGVHPDYHKELTASLAITALPVPAQVVIPLLQHIGAPCEPLVAVGDHVFVGQKIGESKEFVSAPVHASVSGKVAAIGPYRHSMGKAVEAITIVSDGEDKRDPSLQAPPPLEELTPDEIRRLIREAGIVGLGGACFPAHVKLSPPADKPIDLVILNGAECEPYLTADHRLMLERPEDIVFGLKAIMKALGAKTGIIGIENNKLDALRVLRQAVEGSPGIRVVSLPTKYPQGAEKMLIKATTRRIVPSGGLPMDVGVVNHNVGTAVAVAEALKQGKPLYERVVTVTGGGVARPCNLLIRIGTLVKEVLEACGGVKEDAVKLVIGGPMMGLAQPDADIPVVKGTSGITVLTREEMALREAVPCIRCGKCVDVCPMGLVPVTLAQLTEHKLFERAEKMHVMDCIECGCCAYVCPASRPLTQYFRLAKAQVMGRKRK